MATSHSLKWTQSEHGMLKNKTFTLILNGVEHVTLFLLPSGHWYVVFEQEETRVPESRGHSDLIGLERIQKTLEKEAIKFANSKRK